MCRGQSVQFSHSERLCAPLRAKNACPIIRNKQPSHHTAYHLRNVGPLHTTPDNLGVPKMMRIICVFTFSSWMLIGSVSPTFSQTIMRGERITPTARACQTALEDGVVIPTNGTDARYGSEVYVFYRGTLYFFVIQASAQGPAISCVAWEM